MQLISYGMINNMYIIKTYVYVYLLLIVYIICYLLIKLQLFIFIICTYSCYIYNISILQLHF